MNLIFTFFFFKKKGGGKWKCYRCRYRSEIIRSNLEWDRKRIRSVKILFNDLRSSLGKGESEINIKWR